MKNNKKITKITKGILICSVLLNINTVFATNKNDKENKIVQNETKTFFAQKLVPQNFENKIYFNGKIEEANSVSIQSNNSTLIVKDIRASEAQKVNKNQTLILLDNTELTLQKEQIQANIEQSRAALELASFNFEGAKNLLSSGSISAQQYKQFENSFKSETAKLKLLQAQLKEKEYRINTSVIKSPVSGIVKEVIAKKGQIANSVLMTIVEDQQLKIKASISPNYAVEVKKDKEIFVINSFNQEQVKAKIENVLPAIDEKTGQLSFFASIDKNENPLDKGFLINSYTKGFFVQEEKNKLLIAQSAVIVDDANEFVFKFNEKTGAVQKTKITTGKIVKDNILEVVSGLNSGDIIIVLGAKQLKDGQKINIKYKEN